MRTNSQASASYDTEFFTEALSPSRKLGIRLQDLHPAKVALAGILAYLVLFMVAPVRVAVPLPWSAAGYLAACYAAFLFGASFLGPALSRDITPSAVRRLISPRLRLIVTLMGMVGIILRFVDRFFLRGAFGASDVLDRQMALSRGGTTFTAIGAALLYPFCYLPLFFYVWDERRGGKRRPILFLFALVMFFYPAIDGVAVGSRSLLLVNATMFILLLIVSGKVRFTFKAITVTVLLMVILVSISSTVFLNRLDAMGIDPAFSVYSSAYAFTLPPTDAFGTLLTTGDSVERIIGYSFISTLQYMLHGVFEFGYLYQTFTGDHTYGGIEFDIYFKTVHMMFGQPWNLIDPRQRTGIFSTFFGSLYVDFGLVGIPLMGLLGSLAYRIWRLVVCGAREVLPIFLYLMVTTFFFPTMNLIEGAQGLYTVSAFISFILLVRLDSGIASG